VPTDSTPFAENPFAEIACVEIACVEIANFNRLLQPQGVPPKVLA
jgi:hypothetical protein